MPALRLCRLDWPEFTRVLHCPSTYQSACWAQVVAVSDVTGAIHNDKGLDIKKLRLADSCSVVIVCWLSC